jgi:energy-coupling factor transport system substrate-specific component
MTADPASGAEATASPAAAARPGPPPTTLVVALVPLAVAVNFVANSVVAVLGLPIYLDTIGTFLASVLLGPWWGALAGVLTNVVGAVPNGVSNLLFAPVNVAAALLWGYGIRRFGLGRNAVPFFGLAAVVGVVTGVLATPIVLFLFGGSTGHPSDLITAALASFGIERAALVSSVASSVPDKVIASYAGLAITAALPAAVAARAVLPEAPGTRRLAVAIAGMLVGVALAAVVVLAQPPA